MYAIIETGGKQYRVELGSEIQVDRMPVDAGTSLDIDRVLLVADGDVASIGTPMVAGALVRADIVRQDRGEKIVVFKYRPKARRRVKKGHRQELTVLRIADIQLDGRSAAEDARQAEERERQEREKVEKRAAAQAAADQALADKLAAQQAEAAKSEAASRRRRRGRGATAEVAPVARGSEASTIGQGADVAEADVMEADVMEADVAEVAQAVEAAPVAEVTDAAEVAPDAASTDADTPDASATPAGQSAAEANDQDTKKDE